MSACHLKNQNWKRAVETADKVNFSKVVAQTALKFPLLGADKERKQLQGIVPKRQGPGRTGLLREGCENSRRREGEEPFR